MPLGFWHSYNTATVQQSPIKLCKTSVFMYSGHCVLLYANSTGEDESNILLIFDHKKLGNIIKMIKVCDRRMSSVYPHKLP